MRLYTIRDNKVEAYGMIFQADNNLVAVRIIIDAANDQATLINKHPEDFNLYFVGVFDEQTGNLHPEEHVHLGKVIDMQKSNGGK